MPTIFQTKSIEQDKKQKKQTELSAVKEPEVPSFTIAKQAADKLMTSTPKPIGFLASCVKLPTGLKFVNQEPDEKILLFLRRHLITNGPWLFASLFLTIVPPICFFFLSLAQITIPLALTAILTSFYYLVIISYAFGHFISWFYNIGIVTQKRIIDLDSLNILSHNTTAANFDEIVDIKFNQRGFFQSTFDYGDILIQTEALHTNFEFDATPKPTEVTDIISDLRVAMRDFANKHHGNT